MSKDLERQKQITDELEKQKELINDNSRGEKLRAKDAATRAKLEKEIADYVGAKYACSVNSATNAIFLSLLNKLTLWFVVFIEFCVALF